MADRHSKEIRSYNMSCVKNKDTAPEKLVRSYLFSRGLRFRKNDKRYPGHPDIVLPKYHTVVFVHGCFWHQHVNCKYAVMPSSNANYWRPKLMKNRERDKCVVNELKNSGWKVLIVWECQLKKNTRGKTLSDLYENIVNKSIESSNLPVL